MKKDEITTATINDKQAGFLARAWYMYRDGFRNLSSSARALWVLIFIKLFVMFAILRAFFFPNYLNSHTAPDESKGDFVAEQFVQRVTDHN